MSSRKWWFTSIVVAVSLVSACHSKAVVVAQPAPTVVPEAPTPMPPPPPPPRPTPATRVDPPAALSEEELFRRTSLDELNAESPLGDAFFDYDQSTLDDETRTTLQRDAAWLLKWKGTAVTIEGHCDERGPAEYNLALGQRRAGAVRAYLVDLGIDAQRLATLSYGKERPFCRASSKSCWAQNRRGHFVITAK